MQPQPNNGKVRVLLCGYGHLGLSLLEGLLANPKECELVGVFRWSARSGNNQVWEPIENEFQMRIAQARLQEIHCKGMNSYDFTNILQKLKPDVVLVGSWGEILKPHLLNEAKPLIINCHPSKLPAHRGANPYSSVIRQGETETGVTFHLMAAQIDAGAIILQEAIPLTDIESGATVRDKCAATAQQMVPKLLPILNNYLRNESELPLIEQDLQQGSYFSQLKAEDGLLNWNDDISTMQRQMRGLFPWVPCYSLLHGKKTVLFYDPKFVPGSSFNRAPGTILRCERGIIQIALTSSDLVLEVSSYQIAQRADSKTQTFWPVWLNPVLAPFLLKPGHQFISPSPA